MCHWEFGRVTVPLCHCLFILLTARHLCGLDLPKYTLGVGLWEMVKLRLGDLLPRVHVEIHSVTQRTEIHHCSWCFSSMSTNWQKPVYIDHCFHPDCSWRLKVGARQYYKPDAQLRLEGSQWNAYPRHAACRYWQAAGALTLVLASPLITSFQNWMTFSAAYNLLCTYSPSLIKIRRTTFTVSCSQAYIQTDGQTYTSAWILWYPN